MNKRCNYVLILSGEGITLPFGYTLNVIHSAEPIVQKFIDNARHVALHGNYGDLIEIVDDFDPDEEDDEDEYILPVYVQVIHGNVT